ncbi:MAG: hypothetical protein EBT47_01580, partial [Chloroflexi bacterium]|nr:hypothetical protein [Chloroflexota bacterium]
MGPGFRSPERLAQRFRCWRTLKVGWASTISGQSRARKLRQLRNWHGRGKPRRNISLPSRSATNGSCRISWQ